MYIQTNQLKTGRSKISKNRIRKRQSLIQIYINILKELYLEKSALLRKPLHEQTRRGIL